ncbi:MAG: molybdopterin-dependent oxidoreductase [Bacteroidales bacterium]|nr:molybdopterin-dependent oxidoreductase [Bacteroidales bacterium]
MNNYRTIGRSVEKSDALALATGSSLFTDDHRLNDCLPVKILRSPHAHARIINIDVREALSMPGVVDIITHKEIKKKYYTTAGQGYPEPSPYDTLLFDDVVRYVGDFVAMVAAETAEQAEEAIRKIKIEYEVLSPVFDPEKALEPGAAVIHDKEEFHPIPVPYKPKENIAAEVKFAVGDFQKGLEEADFVVEETYNSDYASHACIEPHVAASYFDDTGRLVIITATQVPFHARRIVSQVLDYPLKKIRVIKPRIGGGFGAKQEVLLEPYVALFTLRTKRAVKLIYERKEEFQSGRQRHPMQVKLKMGVKNNGEITALSMDNLMNTGAYGSHALTVLSNSGSKTLPLLNKIKNIDFRGRSVYTNLPVGGAYRGYGATQAYFAINQHIDMICRRTGQDMLEYIKQWHIKPGETSDVFKALGEGKEGVEQVVNSCKLDECIDRGAELIDWYKKRGQKTETRPDFFRGVGMAVSMQGSGIPMIDMAAAYMKMNDDGSFNLDIGATDIGTGSDTILAQIAAEVLDVETENIMVLSSDTDRTPFDVGAYASSTTYVSGGAVKKCAEKIKEQILNVASGILDAKPGQLKLAAGKVVDTKNNKHCTLEEIAMNSLYGSGLTQIQAEASHFVEQSPPPFIAQFAEVEVDKKTGKIRMVKFVSAVDCGQAINPKLAEGQIEGAAVNGITYALFEGFHFTAKGQMTNASFWDYKIWRSNDLPEMETVIIPSDEKSGPFGAKSVGEIGINCPAPAIANAVFDAVGVRLTSMPFTPEKLYKLINHE